MEYMKKIPTLLVIIALLAMNIASMTCAHASDISIDDGINVVSALDADSDDVPSQQSVPCHQCCCHAGSHIILDNINISNYDSPSTIYLISRDGAYPSALDSPPFQPPKV